MTIRAIKLLLLSAIALYFTLVVFNNLTDFDSNYQFVRHVLSMDTTFPGNKGMWRALTSPTLHLAFYWSVIGWEVLTMILTWRGAWQLWRSLRAPAAAFQSAKRLGAVALTVGMLLWLVAFITVGGEWFLMWQSREWNGQDAAFRIFVVLGFVLLLLLQPERDDQP